MKRFTIPLLALLFAGCVALDDESGAGTAYELDSLVLNDYTINPPQTVTATATFSGSIPDKITVATRSDTAFEWVSDSTTLNSGGVFVVNLEFPATYPPTGAPLTQGLWYINQLTAFDSGGTARLSVSKAQMDADTPTPIVTEFAVGDAGVNSVWVQSGEDKITQDQTGAETFSNVWNGNTITLDGMKNEVVSFNTVIEAGSTSAAVTVSIDSLQRTGAGSCTGTDCIVYKGDRSDLFTWAGADATDIELFYVRYINVSGISAFHYLDILVYEDAAPASMQSTGGTNLWADRPGADKKYPDIAVPLELENGFTINAGENQQIWADIYIPADTTAGTYTGDLTVTESGQTPTTIPISLTVHPEVMPDTPSAVPAFTNIEQAFVNWKHRGIAQSGAEDAAADALVNTYYQVAHRHRIDLMGSTVVTDPANIETSHPAQADRFDGTLFTSAQGYAGPGEGEGVHTLLIAPFGGRTWFTPWCQDFDASSCIDPIDVSEGAAKHWAQAWVTAAGTWGLDPWLYYDDETPLGKQCSENRYKPTGSECTVNADCLIDEPDDDPDQGVIDYGTCVSYSGIYEQWATWHDVSGLKGFITKGGQHYSATPQDGFLTNTDIFSSPVSWTQTAGWGTLPANYTGTLIPAGRATAYNGARPLIGSAAPEDDGVALREAMWAMYKLGINDYWIWTANYWQDSNTFGFWSGTRGDGASQGVRDPFVDAWSIGARFSDDCYGNCSVDTGTLCTGDMQCPSPQTCGNYPTYSCDFGGTDNGTCVEGFCQHPQWGLKTEALYGVGSNGDGVLFYPGNDFDGDFAAGNSYGLDGPIVSLRFKHWRRGVQDLEYVAMAAANEQATDGNTNDTDAIVAAAVPVAFYEATNLGGYGNEAQSWSADPDAWDDARASLLPIIRQSTGLCDGYVASYASSPGFPVVTQDAGSAETSVTVEAYFEVTQAASDVVWGVSESSEIASFSDFHASFRFYTNNLIEAGYDDGGLQYGCPDAPGATCPGYLPDTWYKAEMSINTVADTFSLSVGPCGGSQTTLVTNRSLRGPVASVRYHGAKADAGSAGVANFSWNGAPCAPLTCSGFPPSPALCGTYSDGCSGTTDCDTPNGGTCDTRSAGDVCTAGTCCTPESDASACTGLDCGPTTNNCGQTVDCDTVTGGCSGGTPVCQSGTCVASGSGPPSAVVGLGHNHSTCTGYNAGACVNADSSLNDLTAAGTQGSPNVISNCDVSYLSFPGDWSEFECVKATVTGPTSTANCAVASCENVVLDRVTIIGPTTTTNDSRGIKTNSASGLRSILVEKSDFYNSDAQIYCLSATYAPEVALHSSLDPTSSYAMIVRDSRFQDPAITKSGNHVELIYFAERCNGVLMERNRLDCGATGNVCGSSIIQIQTGTNSDNPGRHHFINNYFIADLDGQHLMDASGNVSPKCPVGQRWEGNFMEVQGSGTAYTSNNVVNCLSPCDRSDTPNGINTCYGNGTDGTPAWNNCGGKCCDSGGDITCPGTWP